MCEKLPNNGNLNQVAEIWKVSKPFLVVALTFFFWTCVMPKIRLNQSLMIWLKYCVNPDFFFFLGLSLCYTPVRSLWSVFDISSHRWNKALGFASWQVLQFPKLQVVIFSFLVDWKIAFLKTHHSNLLARWHQFIHNCYFRNEWCCKPRLQYGTTSDSREAQSHSKYKTTLLVSYSDTQFKKFWAMCCAYYLLLLLDPYIPRLTMLCLFCIIYSFLNSDALFSQVCSKIWWSREQIADNWHSLQPMFSICSNWIGRSKCKYQCFVGYINHSLLKISQQQKRTGSFTLFHSRYSILAPLLCSIDSQHLSVICNFFSFQ